MRIAPLALAIMALTGCLATTDLKVVGALPEPERIIAVRIAERVRESCIYSFSTDGNSPNKVSGDLKIQRLAAVKRLYRSDTSGWYKAEVEADGVWDNVYHNAWNLAFACGDKGWQQFPESREIRFVELGTK